MSKWYRSAIILFWDVRNWSRILEFKCIYLLVYKVIYHSCIIHCLLNKILYINKRTCWKNSPSKSGFIIPASALVNITTTDRPPSGQSLARRVCTQMKAQGKIKETAIPMKNTQAHMPSLEAPLAAVWRATRLEKEEYCVDIMKR